MNLSDIISKAAPVIGGLLAGGPVGAGLAALKLVAGELGVDPTEDAVSAAIAADPDALVRIKELELTHKEALQKMAIENDTVRLVETQKTMREEIKSEDPFISRARPSLLWAISSSVVLEIVLGSVIVLTAPAQMDNFVALCAAISIPQSVAAAMCGVYIKERSNDKAVAAGQEPKIGMLTAIVDKLTK